MKKVVGKISLLISFYFASLRAIKNQVWSFRRKMKEKKNGERKVALKKVGSDSSGEKYKFVLVHKRKKGKYGRFLKKSVSIYKLFKFVTFC